MRFMAYPIGQGPSYKQSKRATSTIGMSFGANNVIKIYDKKWRYNVLKEQQHLLFVFWWDQHWGRYRINVIIFPELFHLIMKKVAMVL